AEQKKNPDYDIRSPLQSSLVVILSTHVTVSSVSMCPHVPILKVGKKLRLVADYVLRLHARTVLGSSPAIPSRFRNEEGRPEHHARDCFASLGTALRIPD